MKINDVKISLLSLLTSALPPRLLLSPLRSTARKTSLGIVVLCVRARTSDVRACQVEGGGGLQDVGKETIGEVWE